MATMTQEIAFARYEMFTEAADHLDGDVTDDETECAEKTYVQRLLRRNANRWLAKAHELSGR